MIWPTFCLSNSKQPIKFLHRQLSEFATVQAFLLVRGTTLAAHHDPAIKRCSTPRLNLPQRTPIGPALFWPAENNSDGSFFFKEGLREIRWTWDFSNAAAMTVQSELSELLPFVTLVNLFWKPHCDPLNMREVSLDGFLPCVSVLNVDKAVWPKQNTNYTTSVVQVQALNATCFSARYVSYCQAFLPHFHCAHLIFSFCHFLYIKCWQT